MNLCAKSNVTRRRMPFAKNFFVTDRLGHGAIQVQGRNGGAASRADADGANSIPAEMQSPRVASGIEQAGIFPGFRIMRRSFCSFAKRAGDASQREIIEGGCATSIDRRDVVNVEGGFLRSLGEAAVFAPILCAMNDLTPKLRRDGHGFSGVRCLLAASAIGEAKANHSSRSALRPRAVPQPSIGRRNPVCRADRSDVFARPWAVETLPGHPASALSVGWLETYSLPVSAAKSTRARPQCPNLESSIRG